MKKILFLAVFVVLLTGSAYAQITNCTQVLRLAQSTYEQGRLHELPTLLNDCLLKSEEAGGFTQQQRVDAYRYLTLAYLYLEEPEKADEAMLNLLRTNHYFELNPLVDPAEFVGLYKTFRTTPVFSIGAKGGINGTFPMILKNYYVSNAAVKAGKYTAQVGFQAGLVFEINPFLTWKNKRMQRVTFAPELMYTVRSIAYSNPHTFTADSTQMSAATSAATLKQNWLDLNLILRYKLKNINELQGGIDPYFGFGPGISYLLSAPNTMAFTRANSVGTVTGPDVPTTLTYRKIVPSLMAVAGLKYKFGSIKLTAEFRVQYGLINVVNPSSRTNAESAFDYNYVPSDLKQLNATVNVGFVFPYFNPIKKLHKK